MLIKAEGRLAGFRASVIAGTYGVSVAHVQALKLGQTVDVPATGARQLIDNLFAVAVETDPVVTADEKDGDDNGDS